MLALGVQRIRGNHCPGQVQRFQQRREQVISLVLPSTSAWASTTPACWSAAASRCRACPSALACRVPRTALPSTATARRSRRPDPAAGRAACSRAASHNPTAISKNEDEVNSAAVAAYRASLEGGRPLSERRLAAMHGKTSRRWARNRMAEARGTS